MKKTIEIVIALSMIAFLGIKLNLVSMTPEDESNKAIIRAWQNLQSEINAWEEKIKGAPEAAKPTLTIILDNLKKAKETLESNPHIQLFITMMEQASIREAIPALHCELSQEFKTYLFDRCGIHLTYPYPEPEDDDASFTEDIDASHISFSQNGSIVALGIINAPWVMLFDTVHKKTVGKIVTTIDTPAVAVSPDGKTVAYELANGMFALWDIQTKQQIGNTMQGSPVAFLPDGSTIIAQSDEGVTFWNAESQGQVAQLPTTHVSEVALSLDGTLLAVASEGDVPQVHLWNITNLEEITLKDSIILNTYGDNILIFSPNGTRLAIATKLPEMGINEPVYGVIQLWNVETMRLIKRMHIENDPQSIAFSADGTKIIISSENGMYPGLIIDATTLKTILKPVFLDQPVAVSRNILFSGVYMLDMSFFDFIEHLNLDQCDLLRALQMMWQKMQLKKGANAIPATTQQWETFTTFPKPVQETLNMYIEKPAEGPTHQERQAAFEQRQQASSSSTATKRTTEQPSQQVEKKARTQEPTTPLPEESEGDHDDDDDIESSHGKQKMPRTKE